MATRVESWALKPLLDPDQQGATLHISMLSGWCLVFFLPCILAVNAHHLSASAVLVTLPHIVLLKAPQGYINIVNVYNA